MCNGVKIFTASTFTAFVVCKLMNKPFYNPKFDSMTLIKKLQSSLLGYSVIYTQAVTISVVAYPYLDCNPHNIIRSGSNIAEYALWIEVIYYIYHRAMHNSFLYKWIHAHHHTNLIVYPIDTVELSLADSIGLMITLVAPMWFVQVNFCEYSAIVYVYLTGAFLSHSDVIWDHHFIHHKEFKVNYCFLFPLLDILCGTYK